MDHTHVKLTLVDALITAINAVLPTFFLIGLGAAIDKRFPDLHLETLSRLSVWLLIPALIVNALASTSVQLGAAAGLVLAYLLYLVVLGSITVLTSRGLSPKESRGVLVTTLFGNTGNMGLPITLFAYGQAGLERAVILLVVSLTLMFVAGPTLLAGNTDNLGKRLHDALKLPPIWATLIGVVLSALSLSMPLSVERSVSLLGSAAIPVMLLSLGMQMQRSWTWDLGESALRTTVLRLVVGLGIAYGAARLIGLSSLDTNVLVLSGAMPAAVTMFVVAVEVGGDYKGVARSVVATTIGSLFAIMLVLFLLPPP